MSWVHAYGAFLGVLCGDAAGATLEFARGKITNKDVERAMRMPGGGVFRVGKGQITDDSELALSLARGLVGKDPREGFPLNAVAEQYRRWFDSHPYDIGNTCSTAFGVSSADEEGQWGVPMVEQSMQYNQGSEANGSLMRVLPLALWVHSVPTEKLVEMAKQEATLSHPSRVCQDCNAVYCLLVAHLITHPGDAQGALRVAEEYVLTHADAKVREWFLEESLNISKMDCTRSIGHVRWAFVLTIHFLREKESYEHAIHETLLKGGDTDTNAAIVGGVMGALHGVDAIPGYMKDPVLIFDCASPSGGRLRPADYVSSQLPALTKSLIEIVDEGRSSN
ncbi:hypothetical protein Poli38472_004279 [Pythium oligandrum]|uniref:ADP-ribosyl-[dinitrogen reductase] hydrolase n=1 Tax=Pythium oligandrum TaxID=41045 RepID=A0A8K1CNU0_PYTOL|nr:hypothetical protein Poli38472_004279 [Pythium oligandrum]|eukprot:TMW66514.1 hypothetical protein Poli38472_004279 [Pythium oligandrum]